MATPKNRRAKRKERGYRSKQKKNEATRHRSRTEIKKKKRNQHVQKRQPFVLGVLGRYLKETRWPRNRTGRKEGGMGKRWGGGGPGRQGHKKHGEREKKQR